MRLFGIDAPERDQACRIDEVAYHCGLEATKALGKLVQGRRVTCRERDRDRYGRIVAVCYVGSRIFARVIQDSGIEDQRLVAVTEILQAKRCAIPTGTRL